MRDPTARADPQSFDRFAADYDRFVSLEPPGLPDWLLAHLPRLRRRALDAGCGSGRHSLALADHFDQVVGVDLSQPLIDIARQRRPHPACATPPATCWPSSIPTGSTWCSAARPCTTCPT